MKPSFLMRLLPKKKPLIKKKNQPDFIKMLAVLLNEGYAITEVVGMLVPHHLSHIPDIEEILHQKFNEGQNLSDILAYLSIPKSSIMSIYVAEQHGKLAEALFVTASQLEERQLNKAQMYKLLTYPSVLIVFIIAIFIGFRTFFLPNMSDIFTGREGGSKLELSVSKFLLHLPDYFVLIISVLASVLFVFILHIQRKKTGDQLLLYFKIPLIRRFVQLQLTRQFAFELGSLLRSGLTIQSALHILITQKHQKIIAYIAKELEVEIAAGESLSNTVYKNKYFLAEFYQYVLHGEQGGNLGQELQLLSRFLNERLSNKVEKALAIVQPVLFCIIAICIIAAYLAIMLPMYNMLDIL